MTPADPLPEVVRALNRGMRSMGYYDPSHPVFEAARKEAFDALQGLWIDRDLVTLGGAGGHLVVDAEGRALTDEPARALAARLFEARVVAVRLHLDAGPEDLGRLLEALAERPERIRASGGIAALLEGWGVAGVEAFEVDFGALFAGEITDLGALVGHDPVAELALRGVLRFHEGGEDAPGALGVSFERLDDPESLGGFLDALMEDAGPSVVEGGAGFLTADDVADQAAQAYLQGQVVATRAGASEAALEKSANVLASALVRLSPEARFALLRKLAGADEDESPEREAAAARLGAQLGDDLIKSAVAAALDEHPHDPDVVRAVGNLIRRLRPIESRRRDLLDAIDAGAGGPRLDGVIWQQIRARAEADPGLGMLEMALAEQRERLLDAMQDRLRTGPGYPGMDVVHTAAPAVVENWTVRALADLLEDPGRVEAATVEAAAQLFVDLDAQGAVDEAQAVLRALLARAGLDVASSALAREAAHRCLNGDGGARWAARLLEDRALGGLGLGEVLLVALDNAVDGQARQALNKRLAGIGADPLWTLASDHLPTADHRRVAALVDAAFGASAKLGLKLCKVALKNPDPHVKDSVLKGLAKHPSRDAVAVLAHVAGWKGDRHTRSLLALPSGDAAGLHRHQLTAVGALGVCRSRLAARPLFDLLTRAKLISDASSEALRVAAAQALLTNGTPEAQRALEEAGRHKKKAIREVVERVGGRRR